MLQTGSFGWDKCLINNIPEVTDNIEIKKISGTFFF